MIERIITGLILAVLLLPMLVLRISGSVIICIVVAFLTTTGTWEMAKCMGWNQNRALLSGALLLSVVSPFGARYLGESKFLAAFCSAVFILFFYCMCLCIWSKEKNEVINVCAGVIMTAYITGGLSSSILLRDMRDGYYLFFLIFIGAWITDIFAYFCGMLFGKRKLIEDVSPHKTVAGAIGGILFTVLAFVIFGLVFEEKAGFVFRLWAFVLFGFVSSVVAQMGDLLMSLMKRHYGIKDFGKVFPGHGGVLDRFDSIIAVAPFLYMVCRGMYYIISMMQ